MLIRDSLPEDAFGIAAVHVKSRRAAYAHVLPAIELDIDESVYLEKWNARLAEEGKKTFVADEAGSIIGFTQFGLGDQKHLAQAGTIAFLYVVPEFWSIGLGKKLLTAAEDGLKAMGYGAGYLTVYEGNQRARTFYERNGWAFGGDRWQVDRHGLVTQLRYVKDLKPSP